MTVKSDQLPNVAIMLNLRFQNTLYFIYAREHTFYVYIIGLFEFKNIFEWLLLDKTERK